MSCSILNLWSGPSKTESASKDRLTVEIAVGFLYDSNHINQSGCLFSINIKQLQCNCCYCHHVSMFQDQTWKLTCFSKENDCVYWRLRSNARQQWDSISSMVYWLGFTWNWRVGILIHVQHGKCGQVLVEQFSPMPTSTWARHQNSYCYPGATAAG